MAETLYPEYKNLGVTTGYKTFVNIQNKLEQIKTSLKNGYIDLTEDEAKQRNLPYPYRVELPQFSEEYTKLIEEQKQLNSRANYLVPVLQKLAKEYVPLAGPELDVTKEEKRIVKEIGKFSTVKKTETTVAPSTVSPTPVAGETKEQALARVSKQPVIAEPVIGDGAGGGGLKDIRAKRADVTAGLAALKLPDTAANRQTVRDQIKAGKLPNIRNLPADVSGATGGASGFDAGWQDRFKKEYPAYAWMLTELDKTKYADLFQLMNDAVKPGSEYTDELFQRKFIGTSWYTELAAGQTGRALTTAIGAYSWGEGQLAKFLTTATRMGYTDATLKSKAYEALFSKGADGKYVNPNAIGEVKASSQFLAIKKIGTSFLTPISDESVIDTLVGGRSSDDLMRTSRELAKAKFPHLSNAIDAGVTLEDITYGYKRDAAQLLEVDANTIDMSAGGYSAALGSMKDPMMSTAEWASYIKGTPSFGWQFTKQANQQATDIGLSLARAFGKVK
jgi:hypothetical protein